MLITKFIEEKEFNEIVNDNKNYESYYLALSLLKRTIKTKEEIKKYLSERGYNKENIEKTIKRLEQQKYINDKNYARSYVHNNIVTTTKGPKRIALELEKKGISEEDYEEALKEYSREVEEEKLKKLILKKIGSNHNKSAKILKQKLLQDFTNNGFHQTTIKEILESISIKDDNDIAKKEYQKYYKKLSKKYSGKELEYKIRQKMYNLGFRMPEE